MQNKQATKLTVEFFRYAQSTGGVFAPSKRLWHWYVKRRTSSSHVFFQVRPPHSKILTLGSTDIPRFAVGGTEVLCIFWSGPTLLLLRRGVCVCVCVCADTHTNAKGTYLMKRLDPLPPGINALRLKHVTKRRGVLNQVQHQFYAKAA